MNARQLVFDSGCCKWFETEDGEQCVEQLCSLHAAAPDLLAACEALLQEITTLACLWTEGDTLAIDATYRLRTDEARAAIARARGEVPG